MGMYDTIWVKHICPNCKSMSNIDLQTKSGQRTLHNYKLGDKFFFNIEKFEEEKKFYKHHAQKKFLIFLLGSCDKCRCQFQGCAWINPKSLVIEEIDLHSYTLPTDIKIKLKGVK